MMFIAAVISDEIFCVHGGIPKAVELAEITKENANIFTWNGPSEEPGIGKSPAVWECEPLVRMFLINFCGLMG